MKLNVNFKLPTYDEWHYAQNVFPILKSQVITAEIKFWIYNRPNGTIIDPRCPHMRIYELCNGTDKLPGEIFIDYGNGHDTIALFLITHDDCNLIKTNEILSINDFYHVS